ncbi:regucalcin-like [Bacillus rossius redtenbacheri]|uniref:regucalcin-like n=1 Tax=Bacillus rossius redtenbacheri TaxID=93214 RepID=UPI002FDE9DF6
MQICRWLHPRHDWIFQEKTVVLPQVQYSPWILGSPYNYLRSWWSPLDDVVAVRQLTRPLQHLEGPHWDPDKAALFFVDIQQQLVCRYEPAAAELTSVKLDGGPVSLVVPVKNSADRFVASVGRDLVLLTWNGLNSSTAASTRVLASVDEDKPANRFNDGKADSIGRIWAGTMGAEPTVGKVDPNQGSLYSLNTTSTQAVRHVSNVTVSNGLVWDSTNTILYWTDTATRRVDAFDFDVDAGTIANRRPVFDFAAHGITGYPDGMTIDFTGCLWIACFDGGKVIQVSPWDGRLLRAVELPATRVTSMAWGGPLLDLLYVTTSRAGLSEQQLRQEPDAGSLFVVSGLGAGARPAHPAVRPEAYV